MGTKPRAHGAQMKSIMIDIQGNPVAEEQEGDKTPDENEEFAKEQLKGELDALPEEEELEKPEEKKIDKSEIAQKIRWREKYKDAKAELETFKNKPTDTVEQVDEKEKQAREYLRKIFREEYERAEKDKKSEEARTLSAFEDKVAELLEDNPGVTEQAILDVIEEYEVTPEVAVKILKKSQASGEKPKPKMPSPKQPAPKSQKVDDSRKSMWDIAQEVAKEFIGK